ncbi:MAG: TetR/AcrR family transcriptional regulator [Planctomycetota bacterium]|nr:TetR/AcrR family transcriptional regulator [Planctomycetota bacterium]
MGRPSTLEDKRREFLPIVAGAFAELGYRRLTSAELAARCGVGENVLYRIWPDKHAMFLAALEWVYLASERTWERLLAEPGNGESAFLRLLSHEARHLGEYGLHRIVFAGLSETDDPRIRAALQDLYAKFHAFVRRQLSAHRVAGAPGGLDAETAAWAIIGLGTVANVGRELGSIGASRRESILWDAGRLVAEGRIDAEADGPPRKKRASAEKKRRK